MSLRQDIYCAAHVLIAVYGEDAAVDAALRANELAAAGDLIAGERPQQGAMQ